MSFAERDRYNQLYKTWNPPGFDADRWIDLFVEAGMKMFAFTAKHHEGFSMFDTKTRVKNRPNWSAPGGPKIEACDLTYGIMETPFQRDVVKELCDAGHKRGLKIDLYFSHPDWYDADFRPYGFHPLQTTSSPELWGWRDANAALFWNELKQRLGNNVTVVPDPTPVETKRMLERHRAQLTELLTKYGAIDMLCLDIFFGPKVWPQLRETVLEMRRLQPNVMLRARGIGNYGDYFTSEGFVPGAKENTQMPWFVIYPLGSSFSYDKDGSNYKGAAWIVNKLTDSVAKGGNFMVGVGPNGDGSFHPAAIEQLKQAGVWLKVNGEGIYGTRPREGSLWREGDSIRYTWSKDGKTTYCILLKWPGQSVNLSAFTGNPNLRVHMLGASQELQWQQDPSKGVVIQLPETLQDPSKRPCQYAWTLRLSS
jgi:alpha-L-fucosidase